MSGPAGSAFSVLLGTSGLTLVAIAALVLAYSRSVVAPDHVARIRRVASLALILQGAHFCEEYGQQFSLRFPPLLGLAPWPEGFFVAFNVAWLAAWALAIANLARYPRAAAVPLWFLALASVANGVVHPLLSLAAGGYFPGLWSSPVVGILGVVLVKALAAATHRART